MSSTRDRNELERDLGAVERDLEAAEAQAREAEEALERLRASEAEAAGRLALASRARTDLEQRLAHLQGALREAEREEAQHEYRDAVGARDRAAEAAAKAIRGAAAALAALDDARLAIERALEQGAKVGAELPRATPGDPPVFAEEWSRLEQLVQERSRLQLERDLVEAAASSPMGHAIKDLPAHLQILARARRQELTRSRKAGAPTNS